MDDTFDCPVPSLITQSGIITSLLPLQFYLQIEHAGSYLEVMDENRIMVGMESRKSKIWKEAQELARGKGGEIPENMGKDLLDEVTNLVEQPTAILGAFKEEFLKLPKEILVIVMQKYQRYFSA